MVERLRRLPLVDAGAAAYVARVLRVACPARAGHPDDGVRRRPRLPAAGTCCRVGDVAHQQHARARCQNPPGLASADGGLPVAVVQRQCVDLLHPQRRSHSLAVVDRPVRVRPARLCAGGLSDLPQPATRKRGPDTLSRGCLSHAGRGRRPGLPIRSASRVAARRIRVDGGHDRRGRARLAALRDGVDGPRAEA